MYVPPMFNFLKFLNLDIIAKALFVILVDPRLIDRKSAPFTNWSYRISTTKD